MIAQANAFPTPAARTVRPGAASLVGNKRPLPHRLHLTNGRMLDGELHKDPDPHRVDHLSTLKGYISATNVVCVETGSCYPHIAPNQAHVLIIEELSHASDTTTPQENKPCFTADF